MTYIDRVTSTRHEEQWRQYGADMLRLATVLVGPHDAEDIAVEAYLGVVAKPDSELGNRRAYMMRAVVNRAHDLRRSRERRWRRDLAAIGPGSTDRPDTFIDVRRAVASLTLAQRTVVYFIYWEDLSERDVATMLKISPGTVRRHLVRARAHLRKALK